MMLVSFFAFGSAKPACKFIDAKSKTVKVFSDNTKTWDEARTFCKSSKVLGVAGDLATDTDATTHAFLEKQSKLMWLGGSDTETDGTWKWVTGEAIPLKSGGHWAANEPNNAAGGGQDCMVMNYETNKWDDQKCDNVDGGQKIIPCEYHHRSAKVSNRFLQYFSTPKTFSGAKAECKSNGGLLVVANNDEINTWVAKQGNGAQKWIGATDLKSEGTWLWSDGSAVSTESWNHWTGEGPDNADRVEHCATTDADAQWDDNYCKAKHPFVCQFAKTC